MDFKPFAKIPRFSREMIITEKIDGTNGIIAIGENGVFQIGSRNKWLTDELGNIQSDNAGFAQWAIKNRDSLMALGVGFHYGEWWGSGIQRGYDLPKGEKRFSLFNVSRWSDDSARPACCHVVPTLYSGMFSSTIVAQVLSDLQREGSQAADGFMRPEGVVVFIPMVVSFSRKLLSAMSTTRAKAGSNIAYA
jgi:hypothetical protein